MTAGSLWSCPLACLVLGQHSHMQHHQLITSPGLVCSSRRQVKPKGHGVNRSELSHFLPSVCPPFSLGQLLAALLPYEECLHTFPGPIPVGQVLGSPPQSRHCSLERLSNLPQYAQLPTGRGVNLEPESKVHIFSKLFTRPIAHIRLQRSLYKGGCSTHHKSKPPLERPQVPRQVRPLRASDSPPCSRESAGALSRGFRT